MRSCRLLVDLVLLLVCSSIISEAKWCVQIDLQASFNDVTDKKTLTQKELHDVMIPIEVTLRSILRFTCGEVDIDLGSVRHDRSGSKVDIIGSMFMTPRSPGEDDVFEHRQCVKDSNILKPLSKDPSYFGKLRNKYAASGFLKSTFRDFCGPPIPIPPPDTFFKLDHALAAIFLFCFFFAEILVTGFLYLKYRKSSNNLDIAQSSGPGPSTSSQRPQSSESAQEPTKTSGKMSFYSRKKPKRYEFGKEDYGITNTAAEQDPKSSFVPQVLARKPKRGAPPVPPPGRQNKGSFDDAIGFSEHQYEDVKM